jgi:hypothetical protein
MCPLIVGSARARLARTRNYSRKEEGEMLKRHAVPLLALLMVVLAGCASGTTTSSQTPANVDGTWTGGVVGEARTVTMTLKQSGTQVTGNLSGAGTLDGPIVGTVDGNTIRLREGSGAMGATPMLQVKDDTITGLVGGRTLNLRRVGR